MTRIRTFSLRTEQELQQLLRRERNRPLVSSIGLHRMQTESPDRHIRWSKTILSDDATYPAGTKVIQCELGEYTFDDSAVADVDATYTAYYPQQKRIVYFQFGWRPLGSIVRLSLHDGKWFCLDEASEIYGEITESGGIAAGASGDFTVWYGGAEASPTQTIPVYFDKMASGTAQQGAMALARFFPDEDHFSIVELSCA